MGKNPHCLGSVRFVFGSSPISINEYRIRHGACVRSTVRSTCSTERFFVSYDNYNDDDDDDDKL